MSHDHQDDHIERQYNRLGILLRVLFVVCLLFLGFCMGRTTGKTAAQEMQEMQEKVEARALAVMILRSAADQIAAQDAQPTPTPR